ncbi:Retrovirus-related Pol polyprotein from transposon TNT 1-94 [Senna tora]|uniref:Retrovirus-related Pol polyprotein from transposon TNT 1-94 n=1 Tax=Senna tora TaxID=362788 RepID=A0A834X6V8_9FABA|nr:Retrovirus-related Pol polyprotein from transposon TNT 1-94 [Senna tora]
MVSEPSSSATSSPKTPDPDSKMTDQTSSSIPPPVSYSSSHTDPMPQNFHTTTIKLNDFNFLVWKLRVVSTINGYDLHNYLLGGDLVPPRFLSQNDAASGKVNPAHLFWKKQDQLLMAWLVDSMTEGMLTHIVGCASSAEIWQTLEELFVSQTRAKERQLKTLLRSTKKGNLSMNDYLLEIKKTVDALTSIGAPVSRHDTIESILDGLPEEYEGFVTSISLHTTKYTVPEIHALLLAQETRLDKFKKNVEVVSANVAQTQDNAKSRNYNRSSSQNRGGSQNNRGSFRFPNNSSNNFQSRQGFQQGRGRGRINQWQGQRAQCQVCGKWGHIAVNCYNRYNQNFTEDALVQAQSQMPSSSTSAAPAQALLATPETLIDPDWYPDSGASNHLTNNANNIQQKQPYDGGETVRIGNGKDSQHSSLSLTSDPSSSPTSEVQPAVTNTHSMVTRAKVQKHENGSLLLTQSKYIADLLIKANMSNCKPTNTPMVAGLKLSKSGGADFEDPQLYRTIVGSLQYVLITRPELSFSVNKVSQFMHSPQLQHWEAVKRILRYLNGNLVSNAADYLLNHGNLVERFSLAFAIWKYGQETLKARMNRGLLDYLACDRHLSPARKRRERAEKRRGRNPRWPKLVRSSSLQHKPSRSYDLPHLKEKCNRFISRIGRHRRRHSADFHYDALSYALNFEDEVIDDGRPVDDFRSFSARLPPSPPPAISSDPTTTGNSLLFVDPKGLGANSKKKATARPLYKNGAKGNVKCC